MPPDVMAGALFVILVLVAVGAWVVALLAALQIIGLVPAGQRLDAWIALGAWRFAKVKQLGGPAVVPHVKRYAEAFLAFFATVIASAVLALFAGTPSQDGAPEGQAATPIPLPFNTSSSLES